MSIEAWAEAARRDKYRQDAEHQRAIDTFQSLFEGNTNPDTAGGTISSIYEPLLKHGLKPSPVATLWGILCDTVRALGGNKELTERLVDLLNSISKLPDVTDEHRNAITPEWRSAGVYWRDLPELAMMFREYAIANIEPEDEMDGDWDDQAAPLLNATTFGAMYLARGKQSIGMPFHAEISLMEGTEVSCQTSEHQRRAAMYVPPAATWVLLAGESIYELCKSDYDRSDSVPGSTPDGSEWLWGKGRGYSLGRWAFWKKRFSEIATTQGLKDSVKDVAAKAASEMEKVEAKCSNDKKPVTISLPLRRCCE